MMGKAAVMAERVDPSHMKHRFCPSGTYHFTVSFMRTFCQLPLREQVSGYQELLKIKVLRVCL